MKGFEPQYSEPITSTDGARQRQMKSVAPFFFVFFFGSFLLEALISHDV